MVNVTKRTGRPPRVRAKAITSPDAIRERLRGEIASRLAAELERRGLTLTDLAERAGVSERSLRGWLAGQVLPQLDQVAALADALDVGRGWLGYGGVEGHSR